MRKFRNGILFDRFAVAGVVGNYFRSIILLGRKLKTAGNKDCGNEIFHVIEDKKLNRLFILGK